MPSELPGQHIEGDVRQVLQDDWDMMIAHPPCDHLSVSGASHFKEKQADGRQQSAIDFFLTLANAPIEKICIENPVSIMSTHFRKPDQIIQPWMFGHGVTKRTCLWLKNLPPLLPLLTYSAVSGGREEYIMKMSPSKNRWKERSRTLTGIAKAMADQWY
jgi:site-specific DNA-cytosine methylase